MNERVDLQAMTVDAASNEDQIAALHFEPWVHAENEWTPPTNREWCEAVNPTLIAIRMAWMSLYKTKLELVEMLKNMDQEACDDGDNLAVLFLDSILAAKDRIGAMNVVLESAMARLMIAGSSK